MKETILVTGGTGFLGVHLVRALAQRRYQVRVLARDPQKARSQTRLQVDIIQGDITSSRDVRRAVAGCQAVLHLAARVTLSAKDANETFDVNVGGTRNVMEAAQKAGVQRIVHVSNVGTLNGGAEDSLVDESCPLHSQDLGVPYLDSKVQAERLVLAMAQDGCPALVVNLGGMIGPEDNFHSPSSALLKLFFHRINPFVVSWRLNLADVRDVAIGILQAYRQGQPGERYILGGENTDTITVFRRLREVTDLSRSIWVLPLETVKMLADISSLLSQPLVEKSVANFYHYALWASSDLAQDKLGYRHRPLGETLSDAAAWYEAQYIRHRQQEPDDLAGE